MLGGARYVRDTVANAHEGAVDEEDQPRTLGWLRVQADAEDVVDKLLLDRIVVNDTWIENNRKDPHHCEHEGQHNGHDSEQNQAGNCQVEIFLGDGVVQQAVPSFSLCLLNNVQPEIEPISTTVRRNTRGRTQPIGLGV